MRSRRVLLPVLLLLMALGGTAAAQEDDAGECVCDATAAACDASCVCDQECEVDWAADECASDPDCLAEEPLDDAALEAEELADLLGDLDVYPGNVDAPVVIECACAEGTECVAGACVEQPGAVAALMDEDPAAGSTVAGGCAAGGRSPGAPYLVLFVIIVLAIVCRRTLRAAPLLFLPLLFVACLSAGQSSWDDLLAAGPAPTDEGAWLDVASAEGDAHFSLARARARAGVASVPVRRRPGAAGCEPRLSVDASPQAGALLGWAAADPLDGTEPLVELLGPDGCTRYETERDEIDAAIAEDGYAEGELIGWVWPPGWGVALPVDELHDEDEDGTLAAATLTPCNLGKNPPLIFLYTGVGGTMTYRFLKGCPGEVVIGEKNEFRPKGVMKTAAAHAAGGRTAFVMAHFGIKIRDMLKRDNGVERTVSYMKKKLAAGYDYIVIDEITAHPDWADGSLVNRRFRKVLQRMPARKVIAYISLDLTMRPGGGELMKNRRLLLRALKRRGRALALEVYLHTGEVMNGRAPGAFRLASDRLALAVKGLKYGPAINQRAITVIGTSMHSTFPQYRYLDWSKHDLASITRQVNAIRHGSKRLRQQKGVGYYFVGKSDMQPRPGAPYTYEGLIKRMRTQALRWR